MSLPELREADAPPVIAAVYAEIRALSGVPLVNLIWRHLATLPGALDWAWGAVRPLLASGALRAARVRLAVAGAPVSLTSLNPSTREGVWALAEIYNRGNGTNLLLLTALLRGLDGAPADPADPAPAVPSEPPLPAPPPLPRLDALPGDVADAVRALAARHGGDGSVVPSLYLHLAHWPDVPAALPSLLGPLLEPATIVTARDATVALARREADALRPGLALGPIPEAAAAALPVLRHFTREVIPAMLPIGLALSRPAAGVAQGGG